MRKAFCYIVVGVAVCALLCAGSSAASRPSMAECFEGSDFIANAALSRDAGMSSEAFIGRMEQDFVVIQDFPSELRWFVRDADDEAFLLESAREVFAHPGAAESHRRTFLQACVDRMAG
ncbi:MAG TPA: hypothetical protein VGK75_08295 [Casimicrobiaceae bacterium]|jgi:hypothetical protein